MFFCPSWLLRYWGLSHNILNFTIFSIFRCDTIMNQLLSRNIQKKTKLRMKARNSFKPQIETEDKLFVLILYKISLLWWNISFQDQILTFVEANDLHKYRKGQFNSPTFSTHPPKKSCFWSSVFQKLFWFWKIWQRYASRIFLNYQNLKIGRSEAWFFLGGGC